MTSPTRCRRPTCCWSPRSMPPAKRRSPAPTAAPSAARCAAAGSVEPVFVEQRRGAGGRAARRAARRRRGADHGRRQHRRDRAGPAAAAGDAVARGGELMSVAVAPEFSARVRRNEPMATHTSWHVGGPADLFFTPRDIADLGAFLRSCRPPCRCSGSGSAAICWCATAESAAWSSPRTARSSRSSAAVRPRIAPAPVPPVRAHRPGVRQLGPGTGGVLRRHSRHARRRARHERRRLRRRDLAARAQVETIDRRGAHAPAAAARVRVGYRQVAGSGRRGVVHRRASSNSSHAPAHTPARCARCSSGAARRSPSASGAAARCSPIRPAITRRA